MATVHAGATRRPGRTRRPSFYLVMSLVLAAVIVGGFSQTVPGDFLDTPPLPLLLHVHGAIFTLWVLLVVVQPLLVARGQVGLHRRLGWFGAALAAAMVVLGAAATLYSVRYHLVPAFFPPPVFLVMNLLGIAVFGGLVAAAVRRRRQREWHRRLMLCATISILSPALGRLLPMPLFGPAAPLVLFAVNLAFGAAGMIVDRRVRGAVHPAYWWGIGAIVVAQVAIVPLALAPPTRVLLHAIQGS